MRGDDIGRQQWANYFEANSVQYAFFSALNAKELQEARAATEEAARRAAEGEEDSEEEESGTDYGSEDDEYSSSEEDLPKAARAEEEAKIVDQDPRTRVLSVLELESLFINSAPDLMCKLLY